MSIINNFADIGARLAQIEGDEAGKTKEGCRQAFPNAPKEFELIEIDPDACYYIGSVRMARLDGSEICLYADVLTKFEE